MRPCVFLPTAFAALAASQCLSSIPECAQTCLTEAATQSTTCGETDWTCQCTRSNHQAILQGSENCVEAACGEAQWREIITLAADAFCNAINGGQTCSTTTATGAGSTPTTLSSNGLTATGTGTATATGTSTGTGATSSAGAGLVGAVSPFGMMILGLLAMV